MSTPDQILYLNGSTSPLMEGSLLAALNAFPAKMQKAPGSQWAAAIKGLTSKGVKQAEIDDCEVLPWLSLKAGESLPRDQVIDHVVRRQVTIKQVILGDPKYPRHSHLELVPPDRRAGTSYQEILFIANSERANLNDRIEEIEWEMEQYNFDLEKLSLYPDRVMDLEAERATLMKDVPKAFDFANHHFSDRIAGKHGKNLIAHGRELVTGNLYLVEEIQSDWGQQGRRQEWRGIPKGPFVTDTKLWAGLVIRRMMQRAALNPDITRFAWIRGSMRNGGRQVTDRKSVV